MTMRQEQTVINYNFHQSNFFCFQISKVYYVCFCCFLGGFVITRKKRDKKIFVNLGPQRYVLLLVILKLS